MKHLMIEMPKNMILHSQIIEPMKQLMHNLKKLIEMPKMLTLKIKLQASVPTKHLLHSLKKLIEKPNSHL